MLIAIWPFVVMLIGVLVWALSGHAKVTEMGRIMFFCGLFWTLAAMVEKVLKLG